MMTTSRWITAALMVACSTALVSVAWAVPPHRPDLVNGGNRWTITFYDDSDPGHQEWATQGICFYPAGNVGTHQRYTWASDTFPDWNGTATQEGDQIDMHGDYASNVGHDGMEWELVTVSPRDVGTGHWQEWREDAGFGITIGFGNARLARVGRCKPTTFPEAVSLGKALKATAANPMGAARNQTPK